MKTKYVMWLLGIVVLFIILWWWFSSNEATPISKEEASKTVEEKYPGEILNIEETNQHFSIDIERETGVYTVILDKKSGEVISLKRTKQVNDVNPNLFLTEEEVKRTLSEKVPGTIISLEQTIQGENVVFEAIVENDDKQQKVTIDGKSGEVKEVKIIEPSRRLTEEEAEQIALQHVPGQVDDVDSVNNNGIVYYLVEVEVDEEKEAIVEINSITGEVKSVTWDE